ncbi:MAG: XRE family transcriptional regulator [Marinobacter sp.]|uniref:XRE family transcriptional regulator n=1 Tax=Marinobacter sp. TaxID=50741 RepID=UPI00299F1D18|nr:XRE family transcriptional regulator [Marinobacter sp.]MDX1754760.1 XRE family transcriptional regulator [Marinobacter sp.]
MSKDDDKQRARALEGLLMDAMHAMASMEQVEHLTEDLSGEQKASGSKRRESPPPKASAREDDSLMERLAGITGSALRFASRSTDTSLKVGKALIKSQDQLRMMLAAGQSLSDIRQVLGLTLSEMSEALNLKDKSILEAIENGTATLSFELILRLAALVARNDPIPFVLRTARTYNPEAWQVLNDWGVGRLPLQFERERQFINIFRSHDDARHLSDEGFKKVLEFTRRSFEMSLHFVEEQEQQAAALKARLEAEFQQKTEASASDKHSRRSKRNA